MSLWSQAARIKSSTDGPSGDLLRVLGLSDLVGFGLGCTIGAGIFVSIGHASMSSTPNALWLSFLVAALGCVGSGLSYAEMSTRIKTAGSAYSYAYATVGELPAFIVGILLIFGNVVSAAAVGRSWTGYLVNILEQIYLLTPNKENPIFNHTVSEVVSISPMTVVVIIFCGVLNYFGISKMARINNFLATFNICLIIFFLVAGCLYVNVENSSYNEPFAKNGATGVLTGASLMFFSFLGFDMITTLAEETKSPDKTVPASIFLTILLACTLYILVSLVYAGLVTSDSINTDAPLSAAFINAGAPKMFSLMVSLGALGNTFTTLVSSIVAIPRIIYRMGCDGLLPSICRRVDSNGVPQFSLACSVLMASLLGGLLQFDLLADTVSVGALLAFSVVNAGCLDLRFRERMIPLDQNKDSESEEGILGQMIQRRDESGYSDQGLRQAGGPHHRPKPRVFGSPVGKRSIVSIEMVDVELEMKKSPQSVKSSPKNSGVASGNSSEIDPDAGTSDLRNDFGGARESGAFPRDHTPYGSYAPGWHLLIFSLGSYFLSLCWYRNSRAFLYTPWVCMTSFGAGVLYLRWCQSRRSTQRPTGANFRIPLMPFPPMFAIFANCHLLAGLPGSAFAWTFIICLISFAFYAGYGRHNSIAVECTRVVLN